MRTPALALIAAAVLMLPGVLSLPAAAQDADDADGPHLVDPEGDARWRGLREERQKLTHGSCDAVRFVVSTCGASVGVGGDFETEPAPPAMDLLSATFSETADALVVTMELGAVDARFEAAAPEEGDAAFFMVCWRPVDDGLCSDRVFLGAYRVNGAIAPHAQYDRYGVGCNDWNWCAWNVDYELVEGSPGFIRWFVPRGLLPNGSIGAAVPAPDAGVVREFETGDGTRSFGLEGSFVTGDVGGRTHTVVDWQSEGEDFAFRTPAAGAEFVRSRTADAEGDASAGPDALDLDVLATEVTETPSTLTVGLELARVDDTPRDHGAFLGLGLPDGRVVNAYFEADNGSRDAQAGAFEDANRTAWVDVPLMLEVTAGAPGWVNFTFNRTDLGSPRAGDVLTLVNANTYLTTHAPVGAGGQSVAYYSEFVGYDWATPSGPFRFAVDTGRSATGSSGRLAEDGVLVRDGQDDVTLPALAEAQAALGRFDTRELDVTFVGVAPVSRVSPLAPASTRITLGIQALRDVKPPTGYSAVLYGVALETDAGRFAVALEKQPEAAPLFLCAPDNFVFASDGERGDPKDTLWKEIEGIISYATEGSTSGASTATATGGSITWNVPNACLNQQSADALTVQRLKAASFLVQRQDDAPTTVEEADATHRDDPFVLEPSTLALASTAVPPWYAAPFGVDNFWDILGIAAAVATSSISVAVVQRQRRVLKRYLQRVEDAADAHPGDASAREAALGEIRVALRQDFRRGRIRESHYVLVEQRLDEKLSRARLDGLGDAFADLPHRLLARLQQMLGDGTLSVEDYNLFCTLLEDTALTEDAKARVRRKLHLWVAEDASAESTLRG